MNAFQHDAARASAHNHEDLPSMRPNPSDGAPTSMAQAAAAGQTERAMRRRRRDSLGVSVIRYFIPRKATQRRPSLGGRTLIRLLLLIRRIRFRSLALALMAFAITAVTISITARAIKGQPQVEVLWDKLQYYAANRDRYSVVFLGTSRIYRTIIPEAVDEAMRESGCNETTYNFGVEGMFSVERDYVLDKIISERSPALKVIVTEDVLPSIGKADDANYLSDRVRYFYNIQSLPTFLDSLLSYPESALDTFYRLIYLGIGYVREYSGVSHLASLLPKVGPDSASLYDKGFLDNHGYLALKAETDASFEVRRRSFVEDEQWIVRDRQERDLKGAYPADPRAEKRGAHLAQRLADIAESGIRPAILVLPQERPETTVQAINTVISKQVDTALVLDYNKINQYPEFFDRDLWFDAYHFTSVGARLASKMIGRDLCRAIKQ
ncbi:MAG: hypothetical protein KF815_14250 [Rhodospirillales bacterium]|nr:hypothetical protein [Rhodospirillales bacterium]